MGVGRPPRGRLRLSGPYRAGMSSSAIQTLYRLAARAADRRTPGLLAGRSGSPWRCPGRSQAADPLTYEGERPLSSYRVVAISVARSELAGLVRLLEGSG